MMTELRWTLLILGVVFIAALAWWERRRPRQASGALERLTARETAADIPRRIVREPPLTLPEVHSHGPLAKPELPVLEVPPEPAAVVMAGPAAPDRLASPASATEPPAVARTSARADIPDPASTVTAADVAAGDMPAAELPAADMAALDATDADDATGADTTDADTTDADTTDADTTNADTTNADTTNADTTNADTTDADTTDADTTDADTTDADTTDADTTDADTTDADTTDTDTPAPAHAREMLPELPAAAPLVVNLPRDEERRILALRLVARQPERFPGRSLRQALAAEGFLLGQFAIFHKPDDERRAVLSAANLTPPGTFDMETMDSQHYGGVSLFAVLPGPKSPPQAFDELVFTARNLNDRLHGVLQDEQGIPLTPARIAQLREQLRAGTAS